MNLTAADIHTHNLQAGPDAIINVEPDAPALPQAPCRLSTGVHPWRSEEAARLWPLVEALAADPRVVAIGECGIDRLRGAGIDAQTRLLEQHARLAEATGKPLIIHCVRAWGELLGACKRLRPSVPWIVHGFRGAPELARRLLDAGMHISLGERFNPATAAIIPPGRLHVETDCSTLPVGEIARRVQNARKSESTTINPTTQAS
ncbi:MAG: TatD family hydrolase [Muribaculaceae bacterium]|nr:TatD family hydrolase [Muribaculaceae bacterium]